MREEFLKMKTVRFLLAYKFKFFVDYFGEINGRTSASMSQYIHRKKLREINEKQSMHASFSAFCILV